MSLRTFRWITGAGLVPGPLPDEPLLAADSWLVDRGRVRALERHRRRFAASCAQVSGSDRIALTGASLDAFWSAVQASLPDTGRWFPRVEMSGDPDEQRLSLRIRPAPASSATARGWINPGPDLRRHPRRKGPDLPVLAELRSRAAAAGADDALLVDADGVLLEAAHASVLWWEGDTLCLPPADLPVLPSVTAAVIRERAQALDIPVREVRRRPGDLDGLEVWLVNALHGIRPMREIVDSGLRLGAARRAPRWLNWLDSTPVPVHAPLPRPPTPLGARLRERG